MLKRVPIIVKAYQITFVSCREIGEKTYVATQGEGGKNMILRENIHPCKNIKLFQEDYLLGKRIGKDFEKEGTMGQINAVEYDCAPPSIFASSAGHQVNTNFVF